MKSNSLKCMCILALALMAVGGFIVTGCGGSSSSSSSSGKGGGITCDGTTTQTADGIKLSGTFCQDMTLTAGTKWFLDGGVFIGKDSANNTPTLTIEAGTTIYGLGGTPPGMLVVRRHANIHAVGTAADPIVFTSAQSKGSRNPGDWGGLIINGLAPTNICGTAPCTGSETPTGEGSSGKYGGTDPTDDSGILKYVRVEFAGHVFTSQDELNGIAFQGVGSGTTVDYIQVHRNKDDGMEMFGGYTQVKHVLLTGHVDDSFDWTDGWQGMAQYVAIQQYPDAADQGIEADNNGNDHSASPKSHPILANFTIVGQTDPGHADYADVNSSDSPKGILVRHGTEAEIYNSIVLDMTSKNVDIDSEVTWNNTDYNNTYANAQLLMDSCMVFQSAGSSGDNFQDGENEGTFTDPANVSDWYDNWSNNEIADPVLEDPYKDFALVGSNVTVSNNVPDFRYTAGSPAAITTDLKDVNSIDPFLENAGYRGAMDDTIDWTAGWTTHEPY